MMKLLRNCVLGFFVWGIILINGAAARTVRYELVATRGVVNLSGKKSVDFALMLDGQIPAPLLEFTEGDDAEIVLKNRIPNEELSIHWHGILLPPEMDGVPYVNTPPIRSGEQFSFRFKIRQYGTYWYHSHTNVQEQKGLYGPIVIHPAHKTIQYDQDVVVVLSDWSDENASDILKNLRKDGDYYLYKKDTMRSWLGAIEARSLGKFLYNEWTRMGGMDLSDVGYDAFLINGKTETKLYSPRPGEKVRLRIINAAASSYFYVSLGQEMLNVISADGVDIQPRLAKEILIGMAETYDVLFEVPDSRSYELRVTAQDGTGAVSAWMGSGTRVLAPVKPAPDLYATMSHGHHGDHENMSKPSPEHQGHKAPPGPLVIEEEESLENQHEGHNTHRHTSQHQQGDVSSIKAPVQTLTVDEIQSPFRTEFSKETQAHEVKLELDGDMTRYIWFINGKAIHEERTIEIKEGDTVRFTFVNKTMMHHPMHLHGHFFRVLNKSSAHSPLKHTVDVSPHTTRIIEFRADEPGE